MFILSRRSGLRSLAVAGAATMLSAGTLAAAPLDLFAILPGTWSGGGTVLKTDGTTEALRCRVKYSLVPSGTVVHQDIVCAAASYRMEFVTDLVNRNGDIAGTWTEKTQQASGSVSGRIEGDIIRTQISGPAFAAAVVIAVEGRKQTIALTSDSGNYVKAVRIALKAD